MNGFIHEMQQLLKHKVIPAEIANICFEFYFIKRDRFTVNDDVIFEFDREKYPIGFRMVGTERIDRNVMNVFEWKIQTSKSFVGRIGIIDDTKNASKYLKSGDQKWLWEHEDAITVGTSICGWTGGIFGSSHDPDLARFIAYGDIVTIYLNFETNTVKFESEDSGKTATKNLRDGMDIVRFVVEFDKNAIIKIL